MNTTGAASVVVRAKPFYLSKTFLLGAMQLVVGVLDLIKTNVLDSETAAWGAVLTGALTIVFRLYTNRPVAASAKLVTVPREVSTGG